MVLIYQVLTRQCLKKVFLTSNDLVSNDSSLLKRIALGDGQSTIYELWQDHGGPTVAKYDQVITRDPVGFTGNF